MPKKPDHRPSTRFATAFLWIVFGPVALAFCLVVILALLNGPLPD